MAKKKSNSDRKRRTRSHTLETESIQHVQAVIGDAGFIADRSSYPDYGFDLTVFTFDEVGQLENGIAFLQIKATESATLDRTEQYAIFDVDTRDFNLWSAEMNPVFLALYDAQLRRAYWICFREYCENWGVIPKGKSVRVKIPLAQIVDRSFAHFIRRYKSDIVNQANERLNYGRIRYESPTSEAPTDHVRASDPEVG